MPMSGKAVFPYTGAGEGSGRRGFGIYVGAAQVPGFGSHLFRDLCRRCASAGVWVRGVLGLGQCRARSMPARRSEFVGQAARRSPRPRQRAEILEQFMLCLDELHGQISKIRDCVIIAFRLQIETGHAACQSECARLNLYICFIFAWRPLPLRPGSLALASRSSAHPEPWLHQTVIRELRSSMPWEC